MPEWSTNVTKWIVGFAPTKLESEKNEKTSDSVKFWVEWALPDNKIDLISRFRLEETLYSQTIKLKVLEILEDLLPIQYDIVESVRFHIYSILRTIFQIQFESRGLPIDLELIDELSNKFEVKIGDHQQLILDFESTGWSKEVDKVLHIWRCSRCDHLILEMPHVRNECESNLIGLIMNL